MPKALSDFEKKVGINVRNYRITHNISQSELARYLNLPKQTISRMENGKRKITIEELEKIALFFKEPIQMFYQDNFKYTYLEGTAFGAIPAVMAAFLDDYSEGLSIDSSDKNPIHAATKTFVNAVLAINQTVRGHQKFKEKRERNNLR